MSLQYYLVKSKSNHVLLGGLPREFVLVVDGDEELRLKAARREYPQSFEIVLTGSLDDSNGLAALSGLLGTGRTLSMATEVMEMPGLAELLLSAHLRGVRIIDFDKAIVELSPCIPVDPENLIKLLVNGGVHQDWMIRLYLKLKSFLEPLAAALLLLLLSPVLLLVSLAVKCTSAGPVLYSQTRLGLNGREFEIMKFRSMRTDAEKSGPVWASAKTHDARLSPIGGFLRATHLDELPQFWNILRGELSFIGPRPERRVFSDQLAKSIPTFALRTLVKPGITGWAQIRQGYANSIEDSRKKLELDFYYILKHSPRLDAQIVLSTLGVLATGGTEQKKRASLAAAGAPDNVSWLPSATGDRPARSTSSRQPRRPRYQFVFHGNSSGNIARSQETANGS